MATTTTNNNNYKIPKRPFGSILKDKDNLSKELSIIGLGCSSFSSFFDEESSSFDLQNLSKSHPVVQEWIQTIRYAVLEVGINLLDTAPWYGHGTSEVVVGWALEELLLSENEHVDDGSVMKIQRKDLVVNTKVGRYEADPKLQFNFSYTKTMDSVLLSIKRLNCQYIDVLQLHDPEFAPSIKQLLEETIPAMKSCKDQGYCKALGLTGYPLEVQYQILQASLEKYPSNDVWDQSLTYGHFNLHDSSLVKQPLSLLLSPPTISNKTNEYKSISSLSFADAMVNHYNIGVLAAAPLSMGLLTSKGPPEWHPASNELKQACQQANDICETLGVDISRLAMAYALCDSLISCTLLGMKSVEQVKVASEMAQRFANINLKDQKGEDNILKSVLTDLEYHAYDQICRRDVGPLNRKVWGWDGIEGANAFWKDLGIQGESWQRLP